MKFEDAIRESMRAYYKDREFKETEKTRTKKARYTKKYFDKFEKEQFGDNYKVEI